MPAPVTEDDLRQTQPVLLAFARRSLGATAGDAAQDLVQETLLAAISGRAPFEGRSQVRTWLVGILSRKVADHLRRRSREGLFVDAPAEALERPDPHAPSPEQRAAQRDLLDVIERSLPGLPDGERLAVMLVDVEGVDHAEACNVMAVKPTHLRVLLHRGRHRLRRAVEDAGV